MMKIQSQRWARFASGPYRWVMVALSMCAVVGGLAWAQSTTVDVPTVALASEPLYARGLRVKPTLTLGLSVEFPTVGAAYLSGVSGAQDDGSYDDTDGKPDYVGYYDAQGCYRYDKVNKYFVRASKAGVNRDCGGTGFSGNFMNWATSSAIDILRYALTGGDRIVDETGKTVLQRAILPDGTFSTVPSFWNTSNFPSKYINAARAARALPSSMLADYQNVLQTTGVVVGNCLNRIYIGISKLNSSCGAAGGNGIMGTSTGTTVTPMASPLSARAEFNTTACATENTLCTFPTAGTYKVAYGADSKSYNVGYFTGTVSCNNTIFGDPAQGVVKKCYYSKVAVTPPESFLSTDPFFYARVQVCDTADAASRPDLCQQYPSGSFKPVGNLQKFSDRIRVAVFGYLMDQTTARYGGVLRAPMKYVGPKTYDSSFNLVAGTNGLQEWNATTGVFIENPNSDAMGVSGAINYMNRFGRTGTASQVGLYKRYDPISELYYESLRYVQGLQPTNNSTTDSAYSAISGITADMKAGFPVYTTWDDPVPLVNGLSDYSCINNNILTIGDVNTHFDRYIPGNPKSPGGDPARAARRDYNEPDFFDWTKLVGAFESNHTEVQYVDGKGATRNVKNPMTTNTSLWGLENQVPDTGPEGQNGYYMAGIAYWAATHDVRAAGLANYSSGESAATLSSLKNSRPGMRVTSYFIDVNERGSDSVGQPNHTTNAFYLAAKYGGFTDASAIGNPFLDASGGGTNVNWQSPASPYDPKTYFLGSNGADLIKALNNVFSAVAQQAGSIAGGALSSTQAKQALDTYQAKFDPSDWSGDLVDYPIVVDSTTKVVSLGDDTSATWRASSTAATTGKLDALSAASRNIVIGRSVPSAMNGTATDFKWNTTVLEPSTVLALRTPPYAASTTTSDPESTGEARLEYLRGANGNEIPNGLLFRKRSHKLGDIVNSGVVYKGAPDASISDNGYSTFFTSNKDRSPVVYVGANDGMLHAFNANDGTELFAYIPSMVIPKLAALTSSNYIHTSYVDATPVVAEADIRTSSTDAASWKTVLVSGLGAGGQGVFALDVTSPTSFGAGNVMWEFKDTDDRDMGNVVGRPQIVKVRVSEPNAKTAQYLWFAAVTSGVNNNVKDGSFSDGAPALFLLQLGKSPGVAWENGKNYFKIKFPVADQTRANGIVGFSVFGGNARDVGSIYAGDLQGRMWKLDFSKADFSDGTKPDNWSLSKLSAFLDSSGNAVPLFVATTTSDATTAKPQSISVEPVLMYGPDHGVIVVFGTGRFLEQSDIADTPFAMQSIYSIYDDGGTAVGTTSTPGRAYLEKGTFDTSKGTATVPPFYFGRPSVANDTSASPRVRAGWFYDLLNATALGERVVSSPQIVGESNVVVDSIEPPLNGCADGGSDLYNFDAWGGSGFFAHTDALSGQSQFIQVSAVDVARSGTGSGDRSTTWQPISPTNSLPAKLPQFTTQSKYGRMSWRQILNYQELKNAP